MLLKPRLFTVTACCLLAVPTLFAQTTGDAKYIEVTISDSVLIDPDIIEYTLVLTEENKYGEMIESSDYTDNDDYNNTNNNNSTENRRKKKEEKALKQKVQEKRMADLLNKEKLNFSRQEEGIYSRYRYGIYDDDYKMKNFVIRFGSFEQLDKFLLKIPEDLNYSGRVSAISSTKVHEAEATLLERLLKLTQKQALTIATLTNVKLGSVIQFSDNEGDNLLKGIERLMYSIPAMYGLDKFGDIRVRKITLMKTVRVRYSIE